MLRDVVDDVADDVDDVDDVDDDVADDVADVADAAAYAADNDADNEHGLFKNMLNSSSCTTCSILHTVITDAMLHDDDGDDDGDGLLPSECLACDVNSSLMVKGFDGYNKPGKRERRERRVLGDSKEMGRISRQVVEEIEEDGMARFKGDGDELDERDEHNEPDGYRYDGYGDADFGDDGRLKKSYGLNVSLPVLIPKVYNNENDVHDDDVLDDDVSNNGTLTNRFKGILIHDSLTGNNNNDGTNDSGDYHNKIVTWTDIIDSEYSLDDEKLIAKVDKGTLKNDKQV
jgi:hypothetical protein